MPWFAQKPAQIYCDIVASKCCVVCLCWCGLKEHDWDTCFTRIGIFFLGTYAYTCVRMKQFFHGTAPKPSLDQIHNAIFGYNQESTGRKLMDNAKDETVHSLSFTLCLLPTVPLF